MSSEFPIMMVFTALVFTDNGSVRTRQTSTGYVDVRHIVSIVHYPEFGLSVIHTDLYSVLDDKQPTVLRSTESAVDLIDRMENLIFEAKEPPH